MYFKNHETISNKPEYYFLLIRMELSIQATTNIETFVLNINTTDIHKMLCVFKALEDGWSVEKIDNSYVFRKLHEEKKEYFTNKYLDTFIETYFKV